MRIAIVCLSCISHASKFHMDDSMLLNGPNFRVKIKENHQWHYLELHIRKFDMIVQICRISCAISSKDNVRTTQCC